MVPTDVANILKTRARTLPDPGPLQLTRGIDLLDIDIPRYDSLTIMGFILSSTKNWTGWGNTALFGEYSINHGWGAAQGAFTQAGCLSCGRSSGTGTFPGGTAVDGVTDTEVTMYGFGITQNIDAAATELYLDWRHFSADIECSATASNCSGTGAPVGTVALQKLQTEDFWAVIGGARVKF